MLPHMTEQISRDTVAHVARLARVHLTDEELDRYAAQLGDILAHFDVLNSVDTNNVEPTAQIQPLRNVLAEDKAQESLPVEVVLALAPLTEDGYLRVRAVLE
jgi:aspartyl-tRNA(Asn)/glutamyl-tRNA(Gln) amidotransferase subunit C